MRGIQAVLNRYSKGNFNVRNDEEEDFALLDEQFVEKFRHELKPFWHVIDWDENEQYLLAEMDHPPFKLTAGWVVLREKYDLDDGDYFRFRYLGLYRGNNVFQLTKIGKINSSRHQRLRRPIEQTPNDIDPEIDSTISWEVTLSHYEATGSQLTLAQTIAHQIRRTKLDDIQLVMTVGQFIRCKLLNMKKRTRSLKIGQGWKDFCKENNLNQGDQINFKFMSNLSNIVHVTKVDS